MYGVSKQEICYEINFCCNQKGEKNFLFKVCVYAKQEAAVPKYDFVALPCNIGKSIVSQMTKFR